MPSSLPKQIGARDWYVSQRTPESCFSLSCKRRPTVAFHLDLRLPGKQLQALGERLSDATGWSGERAFEACTISGSAHLISRLRRTEGDENINQNQSCSDWLPTEGTSPQTSRQSVVSTVRAVEPVAARLSFRLLRHE